jgi:hypothetical protein
MGFVAPGEKLASLKITKRLGKPTFFGWLTFGWSEFGDDNEMSGVYQGRPRRKKYIRAGDTISGKRYNFFMKPAWPENTITPARQAVRDKFRDGVNAWKDLTPAEKLVYNIRADKQRRKGFCLFVSEWVKS